MITKHWKAIVSERGRQLNRLTDNNTQRKQPLFPLPPKLLFGVFHSPALNLKAQNCSENNSLKPEGKPLLLTHVQTTMSSSSSVFGCSIVFPLKLMEEFGFTMVLVVLACVCTEEWCSHTKQHKHLVSRDPAGPFSPYCPTSFSWRIFRSLCFIGTEHVAAQGEQSEVFLDFLGLGKACVCVLTLCYSKN